MRELQPGEATRKHGKNEDPDFLSETRVRASPSPSTFWLPASVASMNVRKARTLVSPHFTRAC